MTNGNGHNVQDPLEREIAGIIFAQSGQIKELEATIRTLQAALDNTRDELQNKQSYSKGLELRIDHDQAYIRGLEEQLRLLQNAALADQRVTLSVDFAALEALRSRYTLTRQGAAHLRRERAKRRGILARLLGALR